MSICINASQLNLSGCNQSIFNLDRAMKHQANFTEHFNTGFK